MYPAQNNLTRFIRPALIIIAIIISLIFLSGFSLLTLKSDGTETNSIVVSRINSDKQTSKILDIKDGKKTLFLKKGSYKITADNGDLQTVYYKDLSGFSKSSIPIKSESQKQSSALGSSTFSCSGPVSQKSTLIHYPCNNYSGALELRNGTATQAIVDPLVEEFTDTEGQNSNNSHYFVIKPYGSGFISLASANGQFKTEQLDGQGNAQTAVNIPSLGKMNIKLNDTVAATSKNPANTNAAIFDSATKTIALLKNWNDTSPKSIDISKLVKDNPDALQSYHLYLGDKKIYLVVSRNLEGAEGANDQASLDKVNKNAKNAAKNQKVIVVPLDTLNTKSVNLPDDFTLSTADVSPSDGLLLASLDPAKKTLVIDSNDKLNEVPLYSDSAAQFCWLNDENIYYSTSSDNRIFRYSIQDKASYLAYQSVDTIDNLSCAFNAVSFTLSSERRGEPGQLSHFKLTNENNSGIRLDGILPLSWTYNADTYTIQQLGNAVLVKLEYDSNGNGPSPNDELQPRIKDLLQQQGVETKNLIFVFQ